MPTMNWDEVYADADEASKPPPLGVPLDAVVEDFKWGVTKSGDPMAKARFRITSPNGKGKVVFHNMTIMPQYPNLLAGTLKDLATLGLNKEKLKTLSDEQQAAAAIGREVSFVLEQNGDYVNATNITARTAGLGRAGGPPPR